MLSSASIFNGTIESLPRLLSKDFRSPATVPDGVSLNYN
jgi:hypothetical protein